MNEWLLVFICSPAIDIDKPRPHLLMAGIDSSAVVKGWMDGWMTVSLIGPSGLLDCSIQHNTNGQQIDNSA